MKTTNRGGRILAIALLIALFLTSAPSWALAAEDATIAQVRELIQNYYLEPVAEEVLAADTIKEMLERLGDPYTVYFTADAYESFVGAINQSFSGVGLYPEIVAEGVYINGIVPRSPSEEAGLKAGDIILAADGRELAGVSLEEAVSILRGETGTQVQLKIKRGAEQFEVSVTRRLIEAPTVTGELQNGHIGYVQISSFGLDTTAKFAAEVEALKAQNADCWIFDLRDNVGGYLQTALELAGYFVGQNTVIQTKSRTLTEEYPGVRAGELFNQPVIFLINKNSASASEILAAAIQDYSKAAFLGQTSFGKGVGQEVFYLQDGGYLKLTTFQFFSPVGRKIHGNGVTPDLVIGPDGEWDELEVAAWLLDQVTAADGEQSDQIQLQEGGYVFTVPVGRTLGQEDWEIWEWLTESAPPNTLQREGAQEQTWAPLNALELRQRWPVYFPSCEEIGSYGNVSLDHGFIVRFEGEVDWNSANSAAIELVNSETGARSALSVQALSADYAMISPQTALQPGTEYWLVIHSQVKDVHGNPALADSLIRAVTLN